MSTADLITQHLKLLPEAKQQEVLDFVEYLKFRQENQTRKKEDEAWSAFSLASALRGMEEEETPYEPTDVKESFS